jgi:hypothetical protein
MLLPSIAWKFLYESTIEFGNHGNYQFNCEFDLQGSSFKANYVHAKIYFYVLLPQYFSSFSAILTLDVAH